MDTNKKILIGAIGAAVVIGGAFSLLHQLSDCLES